MAAKQITTERFSVISAKTFAEVASAIAAQVGHPDIKQFYEAIQAAEDDQELQRVVNLAIGPSDLMEFISLDHGSVLRRELGPGAPNVMRLLNRKPAHHEENGEACIGCRLICAGDNSDRRTSRRFSGEC